MTSCACICLAIASAHTPIAYYSKQQIELMTLQITLPLTPHQSGFRPSKLATALPLLPNSSEVHVVIGTCNPGKAASCPNPSVYVCSSLIQENATRESITIREVIITIRHKSAIHHSVDSWVPEKSNRRRCRVIGKPGHVVLSLIHI